MLLQHGDKLTGGIFITFSGNCEKALKFYQACIGGTLYFETFDKDLQGYIQKPVVSGTLISDRIIIHGSDMVHNEGRKIGNHISIFLPCKTPDDRKVLIDKLRSERGNLSDSSKQEQSLIEVTDAFNVRWVLSV